ncbi:uncharacterized protein BDR25DRAFT_339610 [Lindgomyces ingoldianus]|uniref:Uncharacterized protein n=1 Tax=Lindgomyces ingoldianus TaxID=673940 RepID=A0ACB6RBM5_9PLEO|nr:uncharacterized protein BDR25DRAFT_339610 [Lindgomyces ingoldianus]KAF2476683.1 hypothetical protein BDR25DRAFT_339610 [Lindgomyces ingoldianus]
MLYTIFIHVIGKSYLRLLVGLNEFLRHNKTRCLFLSACLVFGLIAGTKAANTIPFEPVQTPTPDQAAAVDQEGGWFYFMNWLERGNRIRSGKDVRQCLLNLAKALEEVRVLSSAEYNGAAGALTLLPTAGALLGAPTREMWIVYKLVPIAGFLSMFLSMGATITPSDIGEFESGKAFSYGGIMPTMRTAINPEHEHLDTDEESFDHSELSEAKLFAREVRLRAKDDSGGDVYVKVWFAIFLQLCFIGINLVAMGLAQRGSVITWWCRVWGWMWFWYFIVIVASVFDNVVAAPFTKSWTLRVAKAPTKLIVDNTQSRVTNFDRTRFPTIMDRLHAGINLQHHVTIQENDPSSYSRTCFYVVVSVEGISKLHAFFQVLSRGCSVVAFAFGTALFASATLMSISAALMLLALVLPMGVTGRVVAMWIAAEMNRHNKSILHTVVKTKKEAGEHIEEIIELPGLQIETMGHIILDGNCIVKRSPIFSAATYIGLLAKPYNLVARAVRNQRANSFGYLQTRSTQSRPEMASRAQTENLASQEILGNGGKKKIT